MNPVAVPGQVPKTEELLEAARSAHTTPFDYIVVGSGAGGGPLAARLAEGGKRVLLLEAGFDPASPDATAPQPGPLSASGDTVRPDDRAVYRVPALHGAATEDARMSWSFSVRHYEDDARQRADQKYDPRHDPQAQGGAGKGGILYPRSSALGGCTAHNAMIVVKPNDSDWNRIAALTGDPSWRAETMQGYFTRIEQCLYYEEYNGFLRRVVLLYRLAMKLLGILHPRWQLDRGGHGRNGWQKTSFISPLLVRRIARGDGTFLRLLLGAILFLVRQPGRPRALLRAVLRLQLVQLLDPNFADARIGNSGQVAFIPVGTDGRQRTGLRERLLAVAGQWPQRLVIAGGTLVTRVLFQAAREGDPAGAPRACGVAAVRGSGLYQVGAPDAPVPPHGTSVHYFAREEVVLAGGTFNTPQLLMLSGIGERGHLEEHGIQGPRDAAGTSLAPIVDLPGVGRNLQDRYEIGVVSRTAGELRTLAGVRFDPADAGDPALQQWRQKGTGLYTTNGGAIAFMLDTGHGTLQDADLFVFGIPVAFRGYYWGWSRQLLRATMDAPEDSRDLWTWVLLKAYTDNNHGTVRLRSDSPFHQPQIDFRSFEDGSGSPARDMDALVHGVQFVRRLNTATPALGTEIQPGAARADDSRELRQWIGDEAWGHHASGTCRMGSDPWQADAAALQDRHAVLDSRLRVHGVQGLRVVDASVFAAIPGYFIVTPVFMVGEKAADMLLADSTAYPDALQAVEAEAIRQRRRVALGTLPACEVAEQPKLPERTVGLALSGGGIRSAIYSLGLLQALASKDRLRQVDLLSTVSGGGYIGAFLGRLYTRVTSAVANPVERVQQVLASTASNEIWWLRRHASYLTSAGRSDWQTSIGVLWRNLVTVHAVIATLLLAVFAGLRWFAGPGSAAPAAGWAGVLTASPWWWLPALLAAGGVLPAAIGYWLAPGLGEAPRPSRSALATWLALLAVAVFALRWPAAQLPALGCIGVLLLAWLAQELVRRPRPRGTTPAQLGVLVRNRLSRGLGLLLMLLAAAVAWATLDSVARVFAATSMLPVVGGMVLVNLLLLPAARAVWEQLRSLRPQALTRTPVAVRHRLLLGLVAAVLAALLVLALDVLVHAAFNAGFGGYLGLGALLVSLVLGRATRFVNASGLHAFYASRLTRTFLGAANPARVDANGQEVPPGVSEFHPQDDLPFADYHPERHGGPLHLFNTCINETADAVTGRMLAEDKGLPLCAGPAGISVGVRYHALWGQDGSVRALSVGANPEAFHVLGRDDQQPARPEALRLSQWMAISGAAFTTGAGRATSLGTALLHGLLNVRLGYWWDSGIAGDRRPGRFPPTFLHRIARAPGVLLRAQRMILDEWRAAFEGPSVRHWYLSDGTHFENSGLYELLRRRVELMIAVDGSEDPDYRFDELAQLSRRARLDFGSRIEWLEPRREGGVAGWAAFAAAGDIPQWIRDWLEPDALGALSQIRRERSAAAALARVHHAGTRCVSWLVLVKPCLGPASTSLDLRCYAESKPQFPNESTLDQFFDDRQWESYRQLGELSGAGLFTPRS